MTNKQYDDCQIIIHSAAVAAGAAGALPVPGSDAVVIVAAQTGMIIALGKVFGVKMTKSAAEAMALTVVAKNAGRLIAGGLMKFVRGESCEKFVSFITGEVDVFLITSYFLRPEVVWGRERDKIDINELVNKLTDLYNYVWKNDISSFDEKTISPDCDRGLIGHLQVSSTTAKSLLDIIGLLD